MTECMLDLHNYSKIQIKQYKHKSVVEGAFTVFQLILVDCPLWVLVLGWSRFLHTIDIVHLSSFTYC